MSYMLALVYSLLLTADDDIRTSIQETIKILSFAGIFWESSYELQAPIDTVTGDSQASLACSDGVDGAEKNREKLPRTPRDTNNLSERSATVRKPEMQFNFRCPGTSERIPPKRCGQELDGATSTGVDDRECVANV